MIYLVADIHGVIRLKFLDKLLKPLKLVDSDYLLILGDAGLVWSEDRTAIDYYESLKCQVLFVDGNHENFTLLNQYPVEEWNGGKVHRISYNIFHLMRGEVFNFFGKKCFVFGGGFSKKRLSGNSPVLVWKEEMPNKYEYLNGTQNLLKTDKVDYVFTHVAPTDILENMSIDILQEERELNDYLLEVSHLTRDAQWFFGHYHVDFNISHYRGVYNDLVVLEVLHG